jgi:hypothetical protein
VIGDTEGVSMMYKSIDGEESSFFYNIRSLSTFKKVFFLMCIIAAISAVLSVTLELDSSTSDTDTKGSNFYVYKYTLAGMYSAEWLGVMSYFFTEFNENVSLACTTLKAGGMCGAFALHYVESEIFEDTFISHKTSYWQNMSIALFGDMSKFHPFMHNKIQFLVYDIAAVDSYLRSNEGLADFSDLTLMRRLSLSPNGDQVAHLVFNVYGNLYEMVGPVTDNVNTKDYTEWTSNECSNVQKLNFDPSEVLNDLISNGVYDLFGLTDGGYQIPFWTTIYMNVATELVDRSVGECDVFEDLEYMGFAMSAQRYEKCEALEVSGFISLSSEDVYLNKYRRMIFVRNTADQEALALTAEWEAAVYTTHTDLYNNITERYGSNWNHWLDR